MESPPTSPDPSGPPPQVSALHLQELITTIDGIIWEADAVTFRFTFVSPQAERILGFPVQEWTENPSFWAEHIYGEDRAETVRACERATAQGRNHELLYRMVTKAGRVVWLRDMVTVVCEHGRAVTLRGVMTDVTQLIELQKALRGAEERWQFALDSAEHGVWDWNVETGQVFFSRQWKHMLGYADYEVGDRLEEWSRLTHPDDRRVVLERWQVPVQGVDVTHKLEMRMRCRDGSWKWILSQGRVMEWAGPGRPRRIMGTHTDIDARKRAEADVVEGARRLRIALTASRLGVWRKNLRTGDMEWDARMHEIYGVKELPGFRDFVEAVHPADRSWVTDAWERIAKGQIEFSGRFRYRRPDGRLIHIHTQGVAPIDDPDFDGWVTGVDADFTAHYLQQARLRDVNERLDLALSASKFGVWELELETGRLIWGESMYALYGLIPEEFEGSPEVWLGCVHPDDRAMVERRMADLMRGAAIERIEFRIVRRSDGEVRVVEGNGYLKVDSDGRPLRAVGMNRDITAQKEAEQTQRRLEARLQQAQKLETLGTLAGGIAHDFNNLLSGIMGHVELATLVLPPQHEAAEYLEASHRACLAARDLIQRILVFARRGPDSPFHTVDLPSTLRGTVALLGRTLGSNLELVLDLAPGLPTVVGSESQIQRVVMNLSVNAAQAIGDRPGRIRIEARAVDLTADGADGLPNGCEPGPHVRLRIADNGSGMDEATLQRIFDPFFTTKPTGSGTGLGLSIVHGIVSDHRGGLKVSSVPGQGSTFDVYLPTGAVADPIGAEGNPTAGGWILEALKELKVLVVDDEKDVGRFCARALERHGAQVLRFDQSPEASRACVVGGGWRPVVALLDLAMPELSGVELAAQLRAADPGVLLVLMSGDPSRHALGPYLNDPSTRILRKPFTLDQLLGALTVLLAGRRDHEASSAT